jgi:hypothetical protein
MKAFILYPKEEIELRKLLEKLKLYGQMNCSYPAFTQIYDEWHQKTFPGVQTKGNTVNFREDWFVDFVNYLINRDI